MKYTKGEKDWFYFWLEMCDGETVVSLLSSRNPWAKDWICGRSESLPCRARSLLAGEVDERPLSPPDEPPLPTDGVWYGVVRCVVWGVGCGMWGVGW